MCSVLGIHICEFLASEQIIMSFGGGRGCLGMHTCTCSYKLHCNQNYILMLTIQATYQSIVRTFCSSDHVIWRGRGCLDMHTYTYARILTNCIVT